MLNSRISKVRALLEERRLDALFFVSPSNLRYLCGFSGSDGALVVTADDSTFLTDSRYVAQAQLEVKAGRQREYASKVDGVVGSLSDCKAKRIGFEAETLTCAMLERLQAKGGDRLEWIGLGPEVAALRGVKDAQEIACLEEAARVAAAAFSEILPQIRVGVEEREVALGLEFAMRRHGGEDKSFEPIVASGGRGALPHGRASERRLCSGELVTIDFGLRYQGYCSDETVTVAIGAVPEKLQRVYETVLEAQRRAIQAVQPGVPLREIDAVARSYIAAAGYGDYFGHGLGHGIGLEVHEFPTLSPRSETVAAEGMVFSVEPGIYIPETGGVRIEDVVVVTSDGCRKVTKLSKEYRQLP